MQPAHQVAEALVAMAIERAERLLADHVGQDDVVIGVLLRGADGGQARDVGGIGVATAGIVGGDVVLQPLDDDRPDVHARAARPIGQVLLGGGAGLHADGGAIQRAGIGHAQAALHHEALAVEEVDAREVEAERGVAAQRPGRVAAQDVHFAGLKRGEAHLGGGGHEAHLGRVIEDRDGERAAVIHVEAAPDALAVGLREAGQAGIHAADQRAAGADRIQRG